MQRAWYQGQVAKFFSFDEAPLSGSNVPLSQIYVTFNINPDQPNGGPGSGFKAEPNSEQTHNVPATLPGDAGYSPLWLVAVYDNGWARASATAENTGNDVLQSLRYSAPKDTKRSRLPNG